VWPAAAGTTTVGAVSSTSCSPGERLRSSNAFTDDEKRMMSKGTNRSARTTSGPRSDVSAVFRSALDPGQEPVTDFDALGAVLLVPALIAAQGRARSFEQWWRLEDTPLGVVESCYLDDHRMEAFALALPAGGHGIGVHEALAYAFFDLFALCFSSPSFLPEIGNVSLERADRVDARAKPPGYGFFRQAASDPIDPDRDITHPLCPLRSRAVLYLTGMALDLVWTHELAHVVLGHLGFADTVLGVRTLRESPSGEGDERLMPLEAEADRFGVITICQTATISSCPYLPRDLHDLPVSVRVRCAFVCTALVTWFWSVQQKIDITYDLEDPYRHGSHPPPLARLHLGFDAAEEMLGKLGWSDAQREAVSTEAKRELAHLANAKGWFGTLDPERAFRSDAQASLEALKRIMGETFRRIAPALEANRYAPP